MDTNIKITRLAAVQIYECIKAMTGSPNYQILRQRVLRKIEQAWPETLKNDCPTSPEETRNLILSSQEQRAIAEGYLALFNKKDQSGEFSLNTASFDVVQNAAKTCKVWNWLKTQIDQQQVSDFDQPLDDEPPISDEEVEGDKIQ